MGLLNKHCVSFLLLQEAKMRLFDLFWVRSLRGNYAFEYDCILSGGILYVWAKSLFISKNIFCGDNYIFIEGVWVPTNTRWLVILVLAPQGVMQKSSYGAALKVYNPMTWRGYCYGRF